MFVSFLLPLLLLFRLVRKFMGQNLLGFGEKFRFFCFSFSICLTSDRSCNRREVDSEPNAIYFFNSAVDSRHWHRTLVHDVGTPFGPVQYFNNFHGKSPFHFTFLGMTPHTTYSCQWIFDLIFFPNAFWTTPAETDALAFGNFVLGKKKKTWNVRKENIVRMATAQSRTKR